MKIRFATEQDMAGVQAVYEPYVIHTSYTFEYEVPSVEAFCERYKRVTEYFPWLVLEEDGEIGGYAYAEHIFSRAAYQWNVDSAVYLKESWQGRGAARAAYGCLEDLLVQQGVYTIYALVTSANERSRKFHEKIGYEKESVFRKTGYKHGAWLDVTWYVRRLRSADSAPEPTMAFKDLPQEQVQGILRKWNERLAGR